VEHWSLVSKVLYNVAYLTTLIGNNCIKMYRKLASYDKASGPIKHIYMINLEVSLKRIVNYDIRKL